MIQEYRGIQITKLREFRVPSTPDNHHVYGGVNLLKQLIERKEIDKDDIGVLIYVTQTPLFVTPSSIFYVHKELGMGFDCFQYDVNQGGAGFVTGIQLAVSLLLGFQNKKKAVLLFGDNNLPNCKGELENITIVAVLEQNQDGLLRIVNKSFGDHCRACLKDYEGEEIYDEEKCKEVIKTHLAEVLSDYEKSVELGIEEVAMDDSSVRTPLRLIQQKKEGKTLVCTAGAGLSIAAMSCELQPTIYLK